MADDVTELEKLVLTRLLRLNAMVQGVVTGIIAGLAIFVATNLLIVKRGDITWAAKWRPASAALLAAALLVVIQGVIPSSDFLPLGLMVHASAFVLLYFGFWIVLPGGVQSMREIIDLSDRAEPTPLRWNDSHRIVIVQETFAKVFLSWTTVARRLSIRMMAD